MTDLVTTARDLARALLDTPELNRRWQHVQGVGQRAADIAAAVPDHERETLIASAWLHDIGYSAAIAETGLHSLDGARHLRQAGWPDRISALVAHHTCARFEADQRGLVGELAAFTYEESAVMDALTAADLTTSPDGVTVTAEWRIAEILLRYPVDHPVHAAVENAKESMLAHVRRTRDRLNDGAGSGHRCPEVSQSVGKGS